MRKYLLSAVAVTAFFGLASTAEAQRAPIYNWSGLYIGINAGYGFSGNSNIEFSGNGQSANLSGLDYDTGFVGFQIGYNFPRFNTNWLIGVEGDIQLANSSSSFFTTAFPVGGDSTTARANLDWFGTFRGRLGYIEGINLFYVTGGVAFGGVNQFLLVDFDGADQVTFNKDGTRIGYVLGFGWERALNNNWTWKIEYLFIDLGSQTDTALIIPGGTTATAVFNFELHTIRLGLNYRFASGR